MISDMANTFPEVLREGWGFEKILLLVVLLLVVAGIGLLAWIILMGIIFAIDNWFVPTKEGIGRIESKHFEPAHTQTTIVYNAALQMSTPQSTYYPDDWQICVSVGDKFGWISVNKAPYNRSRVGQQTKVGYRIGRMTRKLYVKYIYA